MGTLGPRRTAGGPLWRTFTRATAVACSFVSCTPRAHTTDQGPVTLPAPAREADAGTDGHVHLPEEPRAAPLLAPPLVLGVGQSLCAGVGGQPVLSTEQPYGNSTLWDEGPEPKFPLDASAERMEVLILVPLVEPIRGAFSVDAGYPRFGYPNHVKGETFHTAMANGISARAQALGSGEVRTVHANVCEGARSLADLRRGGSSQAYAAGLFETRAYARLAKSTGHLPWVSAVVLTHGEADSENPHYEAELASYFDELREDLRAITGQTRPITFFATQQNAAPGRGKSRPLRSTSSSETWHLSTVRDDVVCVAPKVDFPYAKDRIHSTASGYRRLGEKLAEAYVTTVLQGKKFRPLEPVSATVTGATVRVGFHVPYPPLVWDETLGRAHPVARHPWAKGRGFELSDDSGDVEIKSARIEATTVVLALGRPPGPNAIVRYAMTQDPEGPKGYRGGEADGRSGELVDSSPSVGEDAETIEVLAIDGSRLLDGSFERRGRRDRLVGPGFLPGVVLVEAGTKTATMSSPFKGVSGPQLVRIFADLRNHGVMFEWPLVPTSPRM